MSSLFSEDEDMKEKIERRYTLDEFIAAMEGDELRVSDELITEDIDGKAIFQVADIRKKYIYMIRKFCLEEEQTHDDLRGYLNTEYVNSLDGELVCRMKKRDGDYVFVPREIEVFGEYKYSDPNEKGKQWELFKKTKERIRLHKNKEGCAFWWWESSPYVSNSTAFCAVVSSGSADYTNASNSYGVAPCFRISRSVI